MERKERIFTTMSEGGNPSVLCIVGADMVIPFIARLMVMVLEDTGMPIRIECNGQDVTEQWHHRPTHHFDEQQVFVDGYMYECFGEAGKKVRRRGRYVGPATFIAFCPIDQSAVIEVPGWEVPESVKIQDVMPIEAAYFVADMEAAE